MDHDLCVNCGIATTRCNTMKRFYLEDEAILGVIRGWIAPRTVTNNDHLCQACWILAKNNESEHTELKIKNTIGHRRVCIYCGRSLLRVQSHLLHMGSERESRIHNIISEWIMPRTVENRSLICHPCWKRADRVSRHFISGPSTSAVKNESLSSALEHPAVPESMAEPSVPESLLPPAEPEVPQVPREQATIVLPDYVRAVETQSKCFIEGCRGDERHRIPICTRKMLLKEYNYYVPESNRVCTNHLTCDTWDFLNGTLENNNNVFTAKHIQDMLNLKSQNMTTITFSNINILEDHIVYYLVGLHKEQFIQILNEVPQLAQMRRGQDALAAYLVKLKTGDSNERLSTLFQIPRRTLEGMMTKARCMLTEHFGSNHLGLNHIIKS